MDQRRLASLSGPRSYGLRLGHFATTASGRGKGARRLNNQSLEKKRPLKTRRVGRSTAGPTEARLLGSRFGRGHTAATRAGNP